jgi:hypothetical protein
MRQIAPLNSVGFLFRGPGFSRNPRNLAGSCRSLKTSSFAGEGRDLLIEAKSSTDTAFCRMAVGQLLDYRRQLCGSATTDLAVLFSDPPGKHVRNFLGYIGIKALWFIGDKVVDASGSILFA